ncbi:MAG: hypothetical protein KatS3mg008_0812 [Acidimicrobiales bacterium]|nr:MAG: hypothetical protein KatS3mg008_0812 [Acidimicrobiales bacterium]
MRLGRSITRLHLLVTAAVAVLALGLPGSAANASAVGVTSPGVYLGGPNECEGIFPDVPTGYPFCQYIEHMHHIGVAQGFSDGTFRPTSVLRRQEFAAFLYRYVQHHRGIEFIPPTAPTFSDVPPSHPFFEAIEWAASAGIMEGFEGAFRPGAPMLRQDLARAMYHFAVWDQYRGAESFMPPSGPTFLDVPASHFLYKEIEWNAAANVMLGFVDGRFRPRVEARRQEAMAVLARYYNPVGVPADKVA